MGSRGANSAKRFGGRYWVILAAQCELATLHCSVLLTGAGHESSQKRSACRRQEEADADQQRSQRSHAVEYTHAVSLRAAMMAIAFRHGLVEGK